MQKIDEGAYIIICIDAADNAEMAAAERGEHCFAHEIMQETPPQGVKIISLCRTERIDLLQLHAGSYQELHLEEFSEAETKEILRSQFSQSSIMSADVSEFHRLSGGNPRVQANALDQASSLKEA
ncbi:MAG: hypothetical protein R3E89_09950, partial [Thiolinea sp.]